jgi:hypothetical protein
MRRYAHGLTAADRFRLPPRTVPFLPPDAPPVTPSLRMHDRVLGSSAERAILKKLSKRVSVSRSAY